MEIGVWPLALTPATRGANLRTMPNLPFDWNYPSARTFFFKSVLSWLPFLPNIHRQMEQSVPIHFFYSSSECFLPPLCSAHSVYGALKSQSMPRKSNLSCPQNYRLMPYNLAHAWQWKTVKRGTRKWTSGCPTGWKWQMMEWSVRTDEVCATERQSLYHCSVAAEDQGILDLPELSKHWIVPI